MGSSRSPGTPSPQRTTQAASLRSSVPTPTLCSCACISACYTFSLSQRVGKPSLCKAYFSPYVGSEGEDISLGSSPKVDQPGVREVMNNFIALVTLS